MTKVQDAHHLGIQLLGIMAGLTVPYVQEQVTVSLFQLNNGKMDAICKNRERERVRVCVNACLQWFSCSGGKINLMQKSERCKDVQQKCVYGP